MAKNISQFSDAVGGVDAITTICGHFRSYIYMVWLAKDVSYTVDAMYISVNITVLLGQTSWGGTMGGERKEMIFNYTWFDSTPITSHVGVRATVNDFKDLMINIISRLSYDSVFKASGKLVVTTTYS